MGDFATFADFATWLLTPAGLGVAVAVVVAILKKWASKRAEWHNHTGGRWSPRFWRWVAGHLWIVSVVVAAVLAVGVTLIQRYGLGAYIEEWWPVVVLVVGAGGWTVSQGIYTTGKQIGKKGRGYQ